jgi:hypothetical protein
MLTLGGGGKRDKVTYGRAQIKKTNEKTSCKIEEMLAREK